MFRKLISNLSYSPSLIGEVAKFAQHLKHEEKIRRIGIIALLVALLLNAVALLAPPESTNTASEYDLLYGGVQTKQDLINAYDHNESRFRDISQALGIKRSEIAATKPAVVNSRQDNLLVASRKPTGAAHNDHPVITYEINGRNQEYGSLYLTSLQSLDTTPITRTYGSHHRGFIGSSQAAGTFAVLQSSGAIALQNAPTPPENTSVSKLTFEKRSYNDSQRAPSHTSFAQPSDRITYTLTARNQGSEPENLTFAEHIDDLLEYADIIDTYGGSLDIQKKTLSWPERTLEANSTASQKFAIRLKSHLPATARGTSNPHSYDCLLTNTFGTTTQTAVECPPAKLVESAAAQLPPVSTQTGLFTGGVVFICAVYLYARTLQHKEEIRLIRRDVNEGVIG